MSYLVDALKKAERERHDNQRADLRSLAEGGSGPGNTSSGRALRWLVGLLVVCNAALLVYLFVPSRVSEAFVQAPPEVVSKSVEAPAAQRADSGSDTPVASGEAVANASGGAGDSDPARQEDETAPARQESAPRDVQARGSARTAPAKPSSPTLPPSNRQPSPSLRLSNDTGRSRSGRVTYSQTPLDDVPPVRQAPPQASAPSGPAPEVAINGHLYSTVPGRSFILVNGRRYHEGERLAEGPAVESIDATGATLNYRGDRYHVKGPS